MVYAHLYVPSPWLPECGLSKGVVGKYVSLTQAHDVTWPLSEEVDEVRLEALFLPAKTPPARFAEPDYFQVHQELKTKGFTLQLLWAEYGRATATRPIATASSATTTGSGVAGSGAVCAGSTCLRIAFSSAAASLT